MKHGPLIAGIYCMAVSIISGILMDLGIVSENRLAVAVAFLVFLLGVFFLIKAKSKNGSADK